METRLFGRSGLKLSVLGFGCGAVGGLMVRGTQADQERAFARAIDAGINYFDTAAQYGDGVSEQTLGRLYRQLKPRNFIYGTKVRVPKTENIRTTIVSLVDASLKRLGLERADILHLHNPITKDGAGNFLTSEQVLQDVVPTFETLRQQGKIGMLGFTATGDTRGRAEGHRCRRVCQRAGELQHAEPVGRCGTAGELSGAGLRSLVRTHQGNRHRRGRHPRSRRRRALRQRGAAIQCQSCAAADRHSDELRRRCGTRAALHAAGRGRFCGEPCGACDALCNFDTRPWARR